MINISFIDLKYDVVSRSLGRIYIQGWSPLWMGPVLLWIWLSNQVRYSHNFCNNLMKDYPTNIQYFVTAHLLPTYHIEMRNLLNVESVNTFLLFVKSCVMCIILCVKSLIFNLCFVSSARSICNFSSFGEGLVPTQSGGRFNLRSNVANAGNPLYN